MARDPNPSFMAGVTEMMILGLLRERAMYGYEVVQAIQARTNGAITSGEGLVYPLLHALERDGALTSERKPVNGRTRVYYALTPRGLARLGDLTSRWTTLAEAIRTVLGGGGHAAPV